MNNEFEVQPTQPQEEKPQMNAVQRFFGVFFSPVATFQDIGRKPSFVLPLVVWIILALAATAVIMPKVDFEASLQQRLEKYEGQLSDADMERAIGIQEKAVSIMSYVGSVLGPIIISLVIAGIFFAAVRIWKAGSTFSRVFSVTVHAFIVQFIKTIIAIPLALRSEFLLLDDLQNLVQSNFGVLLDRETANTALYTLATRIDFFAIWTLILIIIGLSAVSKLNIKQSATISIILWLIYVAITVSIAAISAAMMPA